MILLTLGAAGEMVFDNQDNLIVQDHTYKRVVMINFNKEPNWLKSID